MSNGWPMVALGELLTRSDEWVTIDPQREYRQVTVRLWGKGVTLRGTANGSQIASSRQLAVRAGQFILSRIDARNGAFGLVPESLDDAVVTNDFPAFNLNAARISPAFLEWMSKTHDFVGLCKAASEGTTNRVRLVEDRFLAMTIPLPPLAEQRRIVARIEALAARIAEARGLRRQAAAEASRLIPSVISGILEEYHFAIGDEAVNDIALSVTDGDHQPPPRTEHGVPFIFISNITTGKLDFTGCAWVSEEYFAGLAPSRVPQRGDILYAAVGATYGTPCLVETDSPFCFQRHIAIIKPDHGRILPGYLRWALSSSQVYDQATKAVTGSAQPTVPLQGIRKLRVPVPSVSEQRRIVAHLDDLQARVDALKRLQAETAAELDALLPSILDKAFKGEL